MRASQPTNLDDTSARRATTDIGGQIDVRLTMLSELDVTLSIGAAMAFDGGAAPQRQVMISLKMLR